jgi:hypothetical protein
MSAAPAWEQSKENAAPLQRGRNVASLERGLQPRADDSEQQIRHFESLVRPSEAPHMTEMEEEDPLVHWLSYIKFYQNTFPSDMHEQFLLMERCTRALVKMKHYANDDRFIGVCAKYADKTKDPGQVFKYLHQQKVGSTTALFWIAWAYVAEKDNDFPFAEQIFKKGLSKNAQPLQMLKVRHQQFQRRMSRHWLNSSERNDQLGDDEAEEEDPTTRSRGVLGGMSRDRTRRNDRARGTHQRSGVSSRRTTSSQPQSNTQDPNNEGSFPIFVEPQGENEEENYLDRHFVENTRVIEKDADRRKENTLDAERWNERGALNAHRKQAPPARKVAPPPFAVFVDEECAAQQEQEENEKKSHAGRQRQVRDERTFRERGDEGMVRAFPDG